MNRKDIKWNNPVALQRAILDTYTTGEVFQHGNAKEIGSLKSANVIAKELKDAIDNKATESKTMNGKYAGNYMSVSKESNVKSEIDFTNGWKNQIFEPHGQALAPILWDQGWMWDASIDSVLLNGNDADKGGVSRYAYYPGDHYIQQAIDEIQSKYPYVRIHIEQGDLLK